MIKRLFKLDDKGDTIVEVMVVLAVIGLALSIAYATASTSLTDTRQAEENAQATNYVQSQLEDLRTLASSGTVTPKLSGIFAQTSFCVSSSLSIQATPCTIPINTNSNFIITDYDCDNSTSIASANNPCIDGNGNLNVSAGSHTFIAQAVWLDPGGDGNDTVTQSYIVEPSQ